MKAKIVPTKNIVRLSEAAQALIHRAPGTPGMGLVHGPTGYGKTTAITWLVNRVNGVYVRAKSLWTPHAMMSAILEELECTASGRVTKLAQDVETALTRSQRPLFVDEADYLVGSTKMLEALRDVHDMSSVPVVLIGMQGIDRKLRHRQQLTGRLMREVVFAPCDAADARQLCDGLCEVAVRDDLLDRIHRDTRGSVRLLVVALDQVEREARARGLTGIGVSDWPKGRAFFTGDAPVASGAAT